MRFNAVKSEYTLDKSLLLKLEFKQVINNNLTHFLSNGMDSLGMFARVTQDRIPLEKVSQL